MPYHSMHAVLLFRGKSYDSIIQSIDAKTYGIDHEIQVIYRLTLEASTSLEKREAKREYLIYRDEYSRFKSFIV